MHFRVLQIVSKQDSLHVYNAPGLTSVDDGKKPSNALPQLGVTWAMTTARQMKTAATRTPITSSNTL